MIEVFPAGAIRWTPFYERL